MRITRLTIAPLFLAALAFGACITGPAAGQYDAARTGAGVTAGIRVGDANIRGELLEVRPAEIVLRMPREVVLISFRDIRALSVPDERLAYRGGVPSPEVHERLRLISRFPAGLPAEHMDRLLASLGQAALRAYPPPR